MLFEPKGRAFGGVFTAIIITKHSLMQAVTSVVNSKFF